MADVDLGHVTRELQSDQVSHGGGENVVPNLRTELVLCQRVGCQPCRKAVGVVSAHGLHGRLDLCLRHLNPVLLCGLLDQYLVY